MIRDGCGTHVDAGYPEAIQFAKKNSVKFHALADNSSALRGILINAPKTIQGGSYVRNSGSDRTHRDNSCNELLSKKKKVRVVGRDNQRLAAFTSRGAEAFTANVTDEKSAEPGVYGGGGGVRSDAARSDQ